jgi:GNAT superfamily N-acetyltransferase
MDDDRKHIAHELPPLYGILSRSAADAASIAAMIDPMLCRRVEEASLNAWPALQQSLLDGWVLRFSRGFTKRANSIVPLYPAQQDAVEKIRYCENLYSRERLETIFRLTTAADNASLDALLEQRGYEFIDPTRVLVRELEHASFTTQPHFREVPRDEWLDTYAHVADVPASGRQLHALLLSGIRSEHVFGLITVDHAPLACGVAVLERELVGLFDLVTLPLARRRGHANALVESLLAWARNRGARDAYLQVVEANQPARALYRRLGFEDLYRYWYRVAP